MTEPTEEQMAQLALLFVCPECYASRGMECVETGSKPAVSAPAPHGERTAPIEVVYAMGRAWGHRTRSAELTWDQGSFDRLLTALEQGELDGFNLELLEDTAQLARVARRERQ